MPAFVRTISVALAAAVVSAVSPLAAQDGVSTYYTSLSDSIIHLARGDSVELQGAGPLVVRDEPQPGLMITYYPFLPLNDTAAVHQVALALFNQLRSHFVGDPPFVGMRAVSLRAVDRQKGGQYKLRTYGVVLERHSDGLWYELGATAPVEVE